MKKLYFVSYPGVMGCYERKRLTEKQADALRQKGYTVTQ